MKNRKPPWRLKRKPMPEDQKLPFTDHLDELRKRLIRCAIAIFIGFAVSYLFKERIFDVLAAPLINVMGHGDTMIFTGIPEAFFTYLKVSLLAGIMLATPVILFEFWMFVAPGLYQNEKKLLFPIVLISSFFFMGGALFGYFIVFPFGFQFLLGFASENIQAMPSMREYLSFSAKLLLAFGLVFEMPIVITFLARLGIVTTAGLKKNRKFAILMIFAGSAFLTPPDVVTQTMMAIPLMILYEISILGARVFGRRSPSTDDAPSE
jgi:sec-independent protein translocase protein TatC